MIKKFLLLILSIGLLVVLIGEASARGGRGSSSKISGYRIKGCNSVPVRSHVRKDGTFVNSHHRTSPNSTIKDNWTTSPNINPYTGKQGTKDPFSSP